ncbi:hypothetical protein ACFSHP_25870 [Novosphingobium panipatense]
MRIIVVGWIDAVDAAWYRNQETCPFCFDWSFVKQWVIDTIDWSDPDNPAIRIDASGTDITDNVTTAAQAGRSRPGQRGHKSPGTTMSPCLPRAPPWRSRTASMPQHSPH